MDDAVLVSELERLGDLDEDRSRAVGRDRLLALEQVCQRLAYDVLHGEPIQLAALRDPVNGDDVGVIERSEEHTSELQSRLHLVCRLLLEKKKEYREAHVAT